MSQAIIGSKLGSNAEDSLVSTEIGEAETAPISKNARVSMRRTENILATVCNNLDDHTSDYRKCKWPGGIWVVRFWLQAVCL